VISSGIAVGTLFTLFVVPAFYVLIAADHRRMADHRRVADHRRKEGGRQTGDELPSPNPAE